MAAVDILLIITSPSRLLCRISFWINFPFPLNKSRRLPFNYLKKHRFTRFVIIFEQTILKIKLIFWFNCRELGITLAIQQIEKGLTRNNILFHPSHYTISEYLRQKLLDETVPLCLHSSPNSNSDCFGRWADRKSPKSTLYELNRSLTATSFVEYSLVFLFGYICSF